MNTATNGTTVENGSNTAATGSTPNVNGETAATAEKVKRNRTSPRVKMGDEILSTIGATIKAWQAEKEQTVTASPEGEDVSSFRDSLDEEQKAAFGRILTLHGASQALSVLEFISGKVEDVKKVEVYNPPTNAEGRLYVGVDAEKDEMVSFRSMAVPTSATHGARFVQVLGPFRHQAGADFVCKLGRARSKQNGDNADDAVIYSL